MKKTSLIILSLLLVIVFPLSSLAKANQVPRPTNEFYVYDSAGVLSPQAKNHIINTNKQLYEKSGAQVVVMVVENLGGLDIQSYSLDVFRSWEIGGKGKDNGVLMVVAMEERDIWISSGYGIEGALPDSRLKRIIEDTIKPSFQAGEYETGIISGFNEIINRISTEYGLNMTELEVVQTENNISQVNIFKYFGFIIVLLILDKLIFKGRLLRTITNMFFISSISNRNKHNRRGGPPFGGGSSGGFGGSSGGGGRTGGGGAGGSW